VVTAVQARYRGGLRAANWATVMQTACPYNVASPAAGRGSPTGQPLCGFWPGWVMNLHRLGWQLEVIEAPDHADSQQAVEELCATTAASAVRSAPNRVNPHGRHGRGTQVRYFDRLRNHRTTRPGRGGPSGSGRIDRVVGSILEATSVPGRWFCRSACWHRRRSQSDRLRWAAVGGRTAGARVARRVPTAFHQR
jgi:hypothetical protein